MGKVFNIKKPFSKKIPGNPSGIFVIVCDLPKLKKNSKPVLKNGQPVYVKNYFCGNIRDPKTNLTFFEWHPNKNFSARFLQKENAEKYISETLKLEGAKAELFNNHKN